jgi:hypothetical protein
MSDELTLITFDAVTGKTSERPLSPDEIAENELLEAQAQTELTEAASKAAARESALAKLADLGLTAEEIAAL